MASSKSSVIQFNDEQDPQAELQFQDFSLGGSSSGIATLSPTNTYNFNDSPDTPAESEDLLGTEKKESSFWKFSYYQSFFDIETIDFLQRLKWSFIPVPGRSTFLDRQIRPKPDLYGPFWITFCLVYSTAIMANVASYFNGTSQEKSLTFNFHRVSLSATAIYSYVFLLPIILWGLIRHFQYTNRYTLLEIICVYGYSLAIFVPISIFWIFDAAWLHWILVIVGIALTGAVLMQVFWPIFRDDNKKTGTILLCLILVCHILLGVGFGTLFFQEKVTWVSTPTANPIPPSAAIVTVNSSNNNEKFITEAIKEHLSPKPDETSQKPLVPKTGNSDINKVKEKESDEVQAVAAKSNEIKPDTTVKNDSIVNHKK